MDSDFETRLKHVETTIQPWNLVFFLSWSVPRNPSFRGMACGNLGVVIAVWIMIWWFKRVEKKGCNGSSTLPQTFSFQGPPVYRFQDEPGTGSTLTELSSIVGGCGRHLGPVVMYFCLKLDRQGHDQ